MIFEDDGAKASFQKCLFEACEFAGWTLHAYCVMGNHYHLAVETPEPNLSEGMRWLQSVFANRYNRYRKERGHLLLGSAAQRAPARPAPRRGYAIYALPRFVQGRFKSIPVEDWERLAWLCHYIHLNPLRAGICEVGGLKGVSVFQLLEPSQDQDAHAVHELRRVPRRSRRAPGYARVDMDQVNARSGLQVVPFDALSVGTF